MAQPIRLRLKVGWYDTIQKISLSSKMPKETILCEYIWSFGLPTVYSYEWMITPLASKVLGIVFVPLDFQIFLRPCIWFNVAVTSMDGKRESKLYILKTIHIKYILWRQQFMYISSCFSLLIQKRTLQNQNWQLSHFYCNEKINVEAALQLYITTNKSRILLQNWWNLQFVYSTWDV